MHLQPKLLKLLGLIGIVALCSFTYTCAPRDYRPLTQNPDFYHSTVRKLTEVIVYDIFSPPVASRVYVYPAIAAYETLRNGHSDYRSLAGQVNGLTAVPAPPAELVNFPLAALHAYSKVGKTLVFSEDKMDAYHTELLATFEETGMPDEVKERSLAYGDVVAEHILAWADKDNYKQTRTFPKYTLSYALGKWLPTPPDYMEGIEPSWMKMRPMLLDSASQFKPAPPTEVTLDEKGAFFAEAQEVHRTVKNLSEEQQAIASFWDCNPFVTHPIGHANFASKKISPGGHWIEITTQISDNEGLSLMESVAAQAEVSIAIYDSFISCWDEKWRSVYIRPETFINQNIDEDWVPFLQTPPFPEYPSGHSVVSAASAATLTRIVGDNYSFSDSTEMLYGLQPRQFSSFNAAAEEAALSRLYGGIHFRPAIDNGVAQGRQIAKLHQRKLVTKQAPAPLTAQSD